MSKSDPEPANALYIIKSIRPFAIKAICIFPNLIVNASEAINHALKHRLAKTQLHAIQLKLFHSERISIR